MVDLLARDFLVVIFDNRGFGASDIPPGPYTVADLAGDAVSVLDAAGLERAHVVGASLGGMAAQELAIAAPDASTASSLPARRRAAHAYPMPVRTVELMAEARDADPNVALRRFVENVLGTADERLVEDILAYRRANPPDRPGGSALADRNGFDAFDRVAGIQAPTLIVTGTEDYVVDARNSELLAERIPNDRRGARRLRPPLLLGAAGAVRRARAGFLR